jgi:hypothetical protein
MCLNFREILINPHSPKLIRLMMILKLFLNCSYLFLISIGKFVMFWNLSFLFKKDMQKKYSHNILCLVLDLKFLKKSLILSFIGCEKGVNIVEEYDR